MNPPFDFVMTEHAAWQEAGGGMRRVFTVGEDSRWLATVKEGELTLKRISGKAPEPDVDIFTLFGSCSEVPELISSLRSLGPVGRLRNTDLWDAIGTSVIRQVIRAGQAQKLYRVFCDAYGERVEIPGSDRPYPLFPTPEAVLQLNDDQFASLGMSFKKRPLRAVAKAYQKDGKFWRTLEPNVLVKELQTVPHIGPWTAHASVADWSNDWALYPYGDLAVRTWAKRAAPSYDWPADEPTFGKTWRTLAGEKLGPLTLLTLAWGSQHADVI